MRPITPLLVPILFLLAACTGDRDLELRTDTVAVTPPDDPAAVPAAALPIALDPLTDETLVVEAVVLPIGVQTQVTLAVHEAVANTAFTGHVMSGSCEAPGPTAADLQPVRTDADGRGSSRTAVDVRPEIIRNGNHLLQLRREDADGPRPVACGRIEPLR